MQNIISLVYRLYINIQIWLIYFTFYTCFSRTAERNLSLRVLTVLDVICLSRHQRWPSRSVLMTGHDLWLFCISQSKTFHTISVNEGPNMAVVTFASWNIRHSSKATFLHGGVLKFLFVTPHWSSHVSWYSLQWKQQSNSPLSCTQAKCTLQVNFLSHGFVNRACLQCENKSIDFLPSFFPPFILLNWNLINSALAFYSLTLELI